MRSPNVRQGMVAGGVVAVVAVTATTASSPQPLEAFLVSTALCLVVVLALAAAVRRLTRR